MIGFLIFWLLSFIISYKIMIKWCIRLLKKYREIGYTTKDTNLLGYRGASIVFSMIPGINLCIAALFHSDKKDDFYKVNEELDKKYGEIYLATDGDYENIDSMIRCLDDTNMRLKINKITKFGNIKDKIKLNKILDVFKFNKKELEIEKLKDEIKDKDELIESLLQMRKEFAEYKEEKMKSVPTIQVIEDNDDQEELLDDDRKLVPIMNFSEENDEIIDDSTKVRRK